MRDPAGHRAATAPAPGSLPESLACRLKACLQRRATQGGLPISYQQAATALQLVPPHTIHRITNALEQLMAEDVAAGRPLIAALVVSKWRDGLPAPGFFECAAQLGRFAGAASGPEARAFHALELKAALAWWGSP
jgi:hypothetical protein